MIGLTTSESVHSVRHYCATVPSKAARRRYIVRDWNAEKFDLPVNEWCGRNKIAVAPEDSVTIINANGDCYYAARDWFASAPVDSDVWAAAAWKFLSKRRGGERR